MVPQMDRERRLKRRNSSIIRSLCPTSVDGLKDHLIAMHWTGFGPGRCTEIDALALPNTTEKQRSEHMICPTISRTGDIDAAFRTRKSFLDTHPPFRSRRQKLSLQSCPNRTEEKYSQKFCSGKHYIGPHASQRCLVCNRYKLC